jgi:hypothetical protein
LSCDYSVFKSIFFLDDNYFQIIETVGYTYNLAYLGSILYNVYGHLVVLASLILLIAMIGSIVLTVDFSHRASLKHIYLNEVIVENNTVSFFKFQ